MSEQRIKFRISDFRKDAEEPMNGSSFLNEISTKEYNYNNSET